MDALLIIEPNPKAEVYHRVTKDLLKELNRAAANNDFKLAHMYPTNVSNTYTGRYVKQFQVLLDKLGVQAVLHFKVLQLIRCTH